MFSVSTWQEGEKSFLYNTHVGELPHIFPKLADFEAGKLSLTEEELTGEIKKAFTAYCVYLEREEKPKKSSRELWPSISAKLGEEEIAFVPMQNSTGGATAEVTMFCAIIKNTKQPERAFEVIDALMSEHSQQGNRLYQDSNGMPLNKKIMSPEAALSQAGKRGVHPAAV